MTPEEFQSLSRCEAIAMDRRVKSLVTMAYEKGVNRLLENMSKAPKGGLQNLLPDITNDLATLGVAYYRVSDISIEMVSAEDVIGNGGRVGDSYPNDISP